MGSVAWALEACHQDWETWRAIAGAERLGWPPEKQRMLVQEREAYVRHHRSEGQRRVHLVEFSVAALRVLSDYGTYAYAQ
jgi:hypothetical protein